MVPMTYQMPCAVFCYWSTANAFSLTQSLILKVSAIHAVWKRVGECELCARGHNCERFSLLWVLYSTVAYKTLHSLLPYLGPRHARLFGRAAATQTPSDGHALEPRRRQSGLHHQPSERAPGDGQGHQLGAHPCSHRRRRCPLHGKLMCLFYGFVSLYLETSMKLLKKKKIGNQEVSHFKIKMMYALD